MKFFELESSQNKFEVATPNVNNDKNFTHVLKINMNI